MAGSRSAKEVVALGAQGSCFGESPKLPGPGFGGPKSLGLHATRHQMPTHVDTKVQEGKGLHGKFKPQICTGLG